MPKNRTVKRKYNTNLCDEKMSFDECELAILRHAVDETEKYKAKKSLKMTK